MLTLADIKSELDVTWDDEDTDKRIKNIASRAQKTVGKLIGVPDMIFFNTEANETSDSEYTEAEQLFLDCCRYMYNKAFEDFRKNFADSILSLRAYYTTEMAEITEDSENA